jgi:methyl-accepting chemotaxis protein
MMIVDRNGEIVATNTTAWDGKPLSHQVPGDGIREERWFRDIFAGKIKRGETYYADVSRDPRVAKVIGGEGATLVFAAPIFDTSGSVQRIWVNYASWERIVGDMVKDTVTKAESSGLKGIDVAIIAKDGLILESKDPNLVFRTNAVSEKLEAAIRVTDGLSGSIAGTDVGGDQRIYGFAPSRELLGFKGYGWSVLYSQDHANAVASATALRNSLLVLVGLFSLAILVAGTFIAKGLAKPLVDTTNALREVAKGNLSRRLPIRCKHEVGQMAQALNEALSQIGTVMSAISKNADLLASAAVQLNSNNRSLESTAVDASDQSMQASAAATQVSANVATVAASVEEMGASIKEISKNTSEAANVANTAVKLADRTGSSMQKLTASTNEISQVVTVITSIAEQTNLLALNATIEAARAGEAGKGFAVVANEVKELAKGTAKATEEIRSKIEAIQNDVQFAGSSISGITEVINQVNDISNTIASAVEEQSVTTAEMSRNVSEAAKACDEIAKNVGNVAQGAQRTKDGVSEASTAVNELSAMAAELRSLVSRFNLGASQRPVTTPVIELRNENVYKNGTFEKHQSLN